MRRRLRISHVTLSSKMLPHQDYDFEQLRLLLCEGINLLCVPPCLCIEIDDLELIDMYLQEVIL